LKSKAAKKPPAAVDCSLRFEPVGIESMIRVLDAISWIDNSTQKTIAQFTAIDPRTVGKVLKNGLTLGIIESFGDGFSLRLPYPPQGARAEKEAVLKEALFKMPMVVYLRQFLALGDSHSIAARKAATMVGVENYDESALAPLLKWAKELRALDPEKKIEDLVSEAVITKQLRHKDESQKIVAFLSHSSKDKPFIRQLSSDLVKEGIDVWLDERKILVGDSITEKIGQGLAQSDYFVIALSETSIGSAWVQKELSGALIREVEKRQVTVLPILISECQIPDMLKDKKYADFTESYREGLGQLLTRLKKQAHE
jgi:hypothetical protein